MDSSNRFYFYLKALFGFFPLKAVIFLSGFADYAQVGILVARHG
jgi:hypothetical protein